MKIMYPRKLSMLFHFYGLKIFTHLNCKDFYLCYGIYFDTSLLKSKVENLLSKGRP